ncbi:type II toxin-antitoxin system VapB family antitoxin [Actomonas aquatica]|uniref:Type II toxin-antitoxin system VapB family antitoxin n=1 Tax=Actomonas aquatica TaxID=2866162 RepID=A0ABZ1C6R8_9BACT|nr:type II toxin-antitoxin system VapB family antitoxin [Opitutus sp. WL0086]WRQ87093.1 type II toxin-antitoxin system VapB family antitoxin [Opitutus sp. WL0086]
MKTTFDIPEDTFAELMQRTKAQTKREAVLMAIEDYNRRQRLAAAADLAGTFDAFMDQDDLKRVREDRSA